MTMCTTGSLPGPRWGRLYALAAATILGVGLADRFLRPAYRTPVEVALVVAGFLAMLGWVHASRAALDGLDWCECARATVRAHVVESSTNGHPPRPAAPGVLVSVDKES